MGQLKFLLSSDDVRRYLRIHQPQLANHVIVPALVTIDRETLFVWTVSAPGQQSSTGFTPHCTPKNYTSDAVQPWHPYNGEQIAPYFVVRFDNKANLYLEITPILDEEEAAAEIRKAFPRSHGSVDVKDARPYMEHRDIAETAGPFWVMRHGDYNYAGVSILTRTAVYIHHREVDITYSIGDNIAGKFILEQKNGKKQLRPMI